MIFKKNEDKPYCYTNPWGISGGLFGSATIVLSLVTAYNSSLFGLGFIGFISVIIMLHGFLHSRLQQENNTLWALLDSQKTALKVQHDFIAEQHRLLKRITDLAKEENIRDS